MVIMVVMMVVAMIKFRDGSKCTIHQHVFFPIFRYFNEPGNYGVRVATEFITVEQFCIGLNKVLAPRLFKVGRNKPVVSDLGSKLEEIFSLATETKLQSNNCMLQGSISNSI